MLLQMIQNLYIQNLIAVSSMKKSDGNYEEWATDPKYREEFLKHILIAYYVLFSLVLFLCFLVLPLNFFYHAGSRLAEEEEDDENIESSGTKCCRAMKYTSASVFLLIVLVLLGIFLPFEGSAPKSDSLEEKIEFAWNQFKHNQGFDLITFLLNTVSLVGMAVLILYTG